MSSFEHHDAPSQRRQSQKVVIVGELGEGQSSSITIQDFVIGGESVIPIFSDVKTFADQTAGSPYADKGIEVDLDILQTILRGDEILMLDPGGASPRRLTVPELSLLQSEG